MSSENEPKTVEELRSQLNELNRRLLVQMANIEDIEKCTVTIRKEATETYLQIDAKLNGETILSKGAKNEEQNCDTGHCNNDVNDQRVR